MARAMPGRKSALDREQKERRALEEHPAKEFLLASNGSPQFRARVSGHHVEALDESWDADKVWVAPAYEVADGRWATEGHALLLELPGDEKVWVTGMGVARIHQPGVVVVEFASQNIANDVPYSVVATDESFWFLPGLDGALYQVSREAFQPGISAREALRRYWSDGFDYDGFEEEPLEELEEEE